MYYVTETQLRQILAAIKALPVRIEKFDAADAWIGLYLTVQNIANQHTSQVEPANEEQTADD